MTEPEPPAAVPPPSLVAPPVETITAMTEPMMSQPPGPESATEQLTAMATEETVEKKHSWLRWAIAGAAVLVVGVGAAIGWNQIQKINERDHGPTNAVSDYMTLRTGNDLAAARKMVKDNVKNTDTALLSNEIYTKIHPTKAKITDTKLSGDGKNAEVTVEYSLAQRNFKETYKLNKAGKEGLFFDKWEINPITLPTMEARTNVPGKVLVADADVTDAAKNATNTETEPGIALTLPAYPGSYQIRYEDPNEFFNPAKQNVDILPASESKNVRITLASTVRKEIRESVYTSVKDQLKAKIDACVKSELLGATCPEDIKAVGRDMKDRNVTGRKVAAYPDPTVTYDPATGEWSYSAAGYIEIAGISALDKKSIVTVTELCLYEGTLTRSDDGTVVLN